MAKNKNTKYKSNWSLRIGRRQFLKFQALAFVLVFAGLGTYAVISSHAAKNSLRNKPVSQWSAYSLQRQGLRKPAPGGPCGPGQYEVTRPKSSTVLGCSHGPDPAPEGVNPKKRVKPVAAKGKNKGLNGLRRGKVASKAAIAQGCVGNGQDGHRVQALYVRGEDRPDRFAQYEDSFALYANLVDDAFLRNSENTKRPRWVTDPSCNLEVANVTVPADTKYESLGDVATRLKAAGYDRQDRTYLIWLDATSPDWCGWGFSYDDDRPTPDNVNNTNINRWSYAMVYSGCWGLPYHLAEVHELIHVMGGVQPSAPHNANGNHCMDEYDIMCYAQREGDTPMQIMCNMPNNSVQALDCNQDDYFNPRPAPGSYLATHWNTYNHQLLTGNAALIDFVRLGAIYSSKDGDHLYTADTEEISGGFDKISGRADFHVGAPIGKIYNGPLDGNPNVVPVYRYYSYKKTDHYYTRDAAFADRHPNYTLEGVAGYMGLATPQGCLAGSKPLYTAYSKPGSFHMYTTDYAEYQSWKARSKKGVSGFYTLGCLW